MEEKDPIVCIGNIAIDHIITPGKHEILAGGAAFRVCLGLMLFGQPVKLISSIGREIIWKDVFSVFSKNRVEINNVGDNSSSIQFITTYDENSNIVDFRSENNNLTEQLVKFSLGLDIKNYAFIHICPFEARDQCELIIKVGSENCLVSSMIHYSSLVDKARKLYLEVLPQLDFLFLNEEEAKFLAGIGSNWKENGMYLSKLIRRILFMTLAEKGSAAFVSGELVSYCPPIRLNITNTLGAGDCFVGGALSGLLLSQNPLQCLRSGSLSSMLTIAGKDHESYYNFLNF